MATDGQTLYMVACIVLTCKKGMTMEPTIYQQNGYYNRADYLRCMSEDYCVPLDTVKVLADMLGPNEDFDGLVNALENIEDIEYLFM